MIQSLIFLPGLLEPLNLSKVLRFRCFQMMWYDTGHHSLALPLKRLNIWIPIILLSEPLDEKYNFLLQNCKISNPRFYLVCQSFWVWGREDVNQRVWQGWLACASHFLSTCFWIQFHPLNPVIIINFSLSLLILETWILVKQPFHHVLCVLQPGVLSSSSILLFHSGTI